MVQAVARLRGDRHNQAAAAADASDITDCRSWHHRGAAAPAGRDSPALHHGPASRNMRDAQIMQGRLAFARAQPRRFRIIGHRARARRQDGIRDWGRERTQIRSFTFIATQSIPTVSYVPAI